TPNAHAAVVVDVRLHRSRRWRILRRQVTLVNNERQIKEQRRTYRLVRNWAGDRLLQWTPTSAELSIEETTSVQSDPQAARRMYRRQSAAQGPPRRLQRFVAMLQHRVIQERTYWQ